MQKVKPLESSQHLAASFKYREIPAQTNQKAPEIMKTCLS